MRNKYEDYKLYRASRATREERLQQVKEGTLFVTCIILLLAIGVYGEMLFELESAAGVAEYAAVELKSEEVKSDE